MLVLKSNVGGDLEARQGMCDIQYTGAGCAQCETSYGRQEAFVCRPMLKLV